MILPLALFVLAAAPEPESPLSRLSHASDAAAAIAVAPKGVLDPALVRKRLASLNQVEEAARPLLDGDEVKGRLLAELVAAKAQLSFAKELNAGKFPTEAGGAAREAFADQLNRTLRTAAIAAEGHARSCADLAGNAKVFDLQKACLALFPELRFNDKPSPTPVLKDEAKQIAAVAGMRAAELAPCVALLPSPDSGAQLTAGLEIDALGRVSNVKLTGAPEGADRFTACARSALRRWVFPGVADAEVELPMKLSAAP